MINKSIKYLGAVFLLTIMSGNIFASKPVVGIGEITSNVGGNPQSFQTMLETAISQTNKFELMERSRMDDLLSEQALSAGGLTQGSGEIGGLSGVDYLVYGSITKLGTKSDAVALGGIAAGGQKSEMSVDIRIVDASTGSIRIAKTVQKQASSGGGFAMEGTTELDYGIDYIKSPFTSGEEYINLNSERNGRTYSITLKYNFGKLQKDQKRFRSGDAERGGGGGMDMGY